MAATTMSKNIEWVTHSRNVAHAYEIGLHKRRYGQEATRWKYLDSTRDRAIQLMREGYSMQSAAEDVGATTSAVNYWRKVAVENGILARQKSPYKNRKVACK